MRDDSAQSTSLWMATAAVPPQPALVADAAADVCVVGAGIAGLTTAYLLTREGLSVVVLDDGPVAGGLKIPIPFTTATPKASASASAARE